MMLSSKGSLGACTPKVFPHSSMPLSRRAATQERRLAGVGSTAWFGPVWVKGSAFLSAFFTLVGCHGLHVTAGLVWLAVMMAQVAIKGFRATVERRLLCFSLFWHALDIVWVWLFTVVYLMGVLS